MTTKDELMRSFKSLYYKIQDYEKNIQLIKTELCKLAPFQPGQHIVATNGGWKGKTGIIRIIYPSIHGTRYGITWDYLPNSNIYSTIKEEHLKAI